MVCTRTYFQDLQSRDEMLHCLTTNFYCLMRSQHNLPWVVIVVSSYHYLTELVVVYTTDTSWQCVLVYNKVGNNQGRVDVVDHCGCCVGVCHCCKFELNSGWFECYLAADRRLTLCELKHVQ